MEQEPHYQLYKAPDRTTIAAYISVVLIVFFAAYTFMLQTELQTVRKDVADLKTVLLKYQLEQSNLRTQAAWREPSAPMGDENPMIMPMRAAVENERRRAAKLPDEEMMSPPAAVVSIPVAPKDTQVAPAAQAGQASLAGQPELSVQTEPAAALASLPSPALEAINASPEPSVSLKPAHVEPVAATSPLSEPVRHAAALAAPAPAPELAIVDEPLPQPESRVQGQVLWTNPDQQRVMISCGANDGLQPGKRFTVWRGTTYLGEVRVAKVFQTMSACDISTPSPLGIRVGDITRSVDGTHGARSTVLGG